MIDPGDTTRFHNVEQRPCCVAEGDRRALGRLDQPIPEKRRATDGPAADASRMLLLDGGTFLMGSVDGQAHPADGENPVRPVRLSPFWISATSVSNDEFAAFVNSTGYTTDAERYGWSFVFRLFVAEPLRSSAPRVSGVEWWIQVEGASWNHPMGANSGPIGTHPVVHVSWQDATAYAQWSGGRLPSEAEWEYAARGGLEQAVYPWGNDFPQGRHAKANIFEGTFPVHNTAEDGYAGTAPVDAFEPNGFGLYNTVGNVWEWTADWFSISHRTDLSIDPSGPTSGRSKVIRGGSYLCHDSYCNRFRVSARTAASADSSTGNVGFRLARESVDC